MRRGSTGWLLLLGVLLVSPAARADQVPAVVYLDALASPQEWRVGGARVQRSHTLKADGRPTLHFRVPIQADDAAAWPKMWRALGGDAGADWKRFDRFEFLVMARLRPPATSPLKKVAMQLLCPDKDHAATVSIPFPELDTWTRVSLPIAEIPDLQRLTSMQLYLAKRWYAGVETAEFFVGGFRLVRDPSPVSGRYTLLTPLPSPSQPVLRLEAPPDASSDQGPVPLRIERRGVIQREFSSVATPPGEFAIDLTDFDLSPGQHDLVLFPDQPRRRQFLQFDWQPYELIRANPGEGLVGDNIARVEVRNAGGEAGEVEVAIRLDGARVTTQQFVVPGNSVAETHLTWPLRDGQQGKAQIEVYARDRYVGGVEDVVKGSAVLAGVGRHRAVMFDAGDTLAFRLPVLLAEGSRDTARLHWELRAALGTVVERGDTRVAGPSAEVSVESPGALQTGHHTLLVTLRWGDNHEATAETALYILPSPFSP